MRLGKYLFAVFLLLLSSASWAQGSGEIGGGYSSNAGGSGGGGGGSGTVNNGLAGQFAYYASNGTVVQGTTSLTLDANNMLNMPLVAGVGAGGYAGTTLKLSGGFVVPLNADGGYIWFTSDGITGPVLQAYEDGRIAFVMANDTGVDVNFLSGGVWGWGKGDDDEPLQPQVQVVQGRSGQLNAAGADWTFKASSSTGTGVGGGFVYQVTPAAGSGSTTNVFVTALTIAGDKSATFTGAANLNGGATVLSSFTATGLVTNADLATMATNTVKGNATSGTASPTNLAVGSCSTASSALNWTTNTGFGCNTSITASAVAVGGITGLGTGVATALAVNVGSAGAFVTFNGAGGTPSSMTATNLTGTAASLTVGTANAAPASGLTGTTLASGVVTSSLTTVGTLGSLAVTGSITNGGETITSASATALTVGRQGATQPALQVDASTATQTSGIKIKGSALNGTAAISVIDTSGNTNLTIDALGSGTLTLNGTATGRVTITPVTTISGSLTLSSALIYGGVTLSNAVTGTGNMVLSANSFMTGTTQMGGLTQSGNYLNTAGTIQYLGTDAGADTRTISPGTSINGYGTGAFYLIKAGSTNATTTPTLNISALGAKTIVKRASTALAAGDILSGMIMHLVYDGTNMQLLNPVVN